MTLRMGLTNRVEVQGRMGVLPRITLAHRREVALAFAMLATLLVVPQHGRADGLTATITYPANGAVNAELSQPIRWTSVAGVQAYYLYVGTRVGAKDLVDTGEILRTSYLAIGLPGGQTLYARMHTKVGGAWGYMDSTFSAAPSAPVKATITYPGNGAVKADLTQPIRWTSVAPAQAYYLYVGTTVGAKDLVDTGELLQTSYQAIRLPAGRTLYARMHTKIGGQWWYVDSTFSAARVPLLAFLKAEFSRGDATFYLATVTILVVCVLLFWVVGYDPRRAGEYLRRHAGWIALNVLLVTAAACALMLAPPPPAGSHCVETHRVWGPLEMVLSCDSAAFIESAQHPERLSMNGSYRQTRPLGIMVASLLALAEAVALKRQFGWLPFVVLNFVLLLVSLMVFKRLNAPSARAASVAVAVLGTFLVFNDVVKGFFWSAHTQMWNVLMPLISISLALALLGRPARSWPFMTATGALLGIGLLAYPSLVVCVLVATVAVALGVWINRERPSWLTLFGTLCLFLGAFAAPSVLWISLLKRVTGTFFAPETQEFREFVWMLDSWHAGGLQALQRQTQAFLAEFLGRLWDGLWPVLVLLAVALLVGVVSPSRLQAVLRERSRTLIAAAITLVMCLGFFALAGFYRNRLAFNAVMPVLVMASVVLTGLLERMPGKPAVVTVLLVVAVAGGYVISALVRITWPY